MVRPQIDLNGRLDAYRSTLGTSRFGETLKRSTEKWPVYAAVTGAAMAMASNASAGIIYSGPVNIAAGISTAPPGSVHENFKPVPLKNATGATIGVNFNVQALQSFGTLNHFTYDHFGVAQVFGSQMHFFLSNSGLKRLSSGARISGSGHTASSLNGWVANVEGHPFRRVGTYKTGPPLRTYTFNSGPSATEGFAGFYFSTVNNQKDYGWVRLQYAVGANGLPNSLTAIDWAYQDNGSAITAGEGLPGGGNTPEPSTMALALLACGAAGIAALRKRKKAVVVQ